MPYARQAILGTLVIALVTSGCGKARPKVVPVEGVVRMDGKPLKRVVVYFSPEDGCGTDYQAFGVTDDSGRYKLTCLNKQQGACVGKNRVRITESGPAELPKMDRNGHPITAPYYKSLGGRPLPEKYTNPVDSPLEVDVKEGVTTYDLELRH